MWGQVSGLPFVGKQDEGRFFDRKLHVTELGRFDWHVIEGLSAGYAGVKARNCF